jgi:hypothetical protein
MRTLIAAVVAVAVAVAVAGCAASRHDVAAAKAARYRGDQLEMFRGVRAAIADKYTIELSDETTLRVVTTGRWYTPEGLGASERNGDMRDVPDRSIHLRMIVRLRPRDPDDWAVEIEPVMVRYFTGRPDPDFLTLDDPSVPGWARGRVDQLHSAIHRMLERYQVASPPGPTTQAQEAPAR